MSSLTLSQALEESRLSEFVEQEEKRGIGPADRKELKRLLRRAAKSRQSEDQTSRSACGDGSSGK